MNYLTLFLTEKCNRKCFYCDVGDIKEKRSPSEDYIKQYIPMIAKSDWQSVVLTGGEPALTPPNLLDFIVNQLKFKHVSVNTNGLWFKMKYFDKYYDLIENVQYHPVVEINQDFDIIYDDKIIYNFPIHKNNIKYIKSFIDKYFDIKIKLTPYDNKNGDSSLCLSMEDCKKVFEIIKNTQNIDRGTIQLFRFLSHMLDPNFIRDFCTNSIVAYPSIDFVNGRIKKCIRSHTRSDYVDLTKENFQNLRTLKFHKKDVCDNCLLFVRNFQEIVEMMVKSNGKR